MPTLTIETFAGSITRELSSEAIAEMLPILIANNVPFAVSL